MLQLGFGLSPVQSGSLTFVSSLGTLAVRPVAARLLRWFGFRRLLIGNARALRCRRSPAFALVRPHTPHWRSCASVLVFGIVRSTQFMTTNTLTYADTPAAKLSRSTSLGGVVQQLTVSVGVAIAAALLGVLAAPAVVPSVARVPPGVRAGGAGHAGLGARVPAAAAGRRGAGEPPPDGVRDDYRSGAARRP